MKPVVCVHGIDFRNRGALMMLKATVRAMRTEFPGSSVCVPFTDGTRQSRRSFNVSSALITRRYRIGLLPIGGTLASRITAVLPAKWLNALRWERLDDIDLHLDASGYAYGDPWGPARVWRMAHLAGYWREAERPLLVLPQAFGPFQDNRVADACRAYLNNARIIFARDQESLTNLQQLQLDGPKVDLAPDFTLSDVSAVGHLDSSKQKVALIPNTRFIDVAGQGHAYIDFLLRVSEKVMLSGFELEIVLFEAMDAVVGEELSTRLGCKLRGGQGAPCQEEVLSEYKFAICSRYHSIAAALARGVPALAISWSHKYYGLMRDYGIEEFCFETHQEPALFTAIANMKERLDEIRSRIAVRRRAIERQTTEMWKKVREESGIDGNAED
jgi:hypothetical protein